jgi:hypothetical protein
MRFNVRPARVLSVLTLIAIVNVFVFANGTASSANKAVLGRLVTTSNRPILVNGAEAITGSVILSGARLTTSGANIATVQIPAVASIMIAPSSDVALSFDSKTVTVSVTSGDASVTAADGVVGTVVDAATGKARAGAAAPAGGNTAKNWGIAGVAVGSAGLIWAIIAWNKANDAQDDADAANAAAASLASQLAALRTCLAGQTTSPLKLCTSF